jgi:hypothetical protein
MASKEKGAGQEIVYGQQIFCCETVTTYLPMSSHELKGLLQSGGAGGHVTEDKSDGSLWNFDQELNDKDQAKELIVTPMTTINGNRLINVKELLASTVSQFVQRQLVVWILNKND